MGNHPCTPTTATIDAIYRAAQDGGIIPDVTLDGTLADLLSLNSSAVLDQTYSSIRQNLTTGQQADLHANLTAAFGPSPDVLYGGVGVVALALSFLLQALASSIVGATADPLAKAFGWDNSSEIALIARQYLELVAEKANEVEEMGEITELYDQKLKYALIELYESMTLDHQMSSAGLKQWVNGAALHLHLRIHGIHLASVPKGTAESLRLSYRTALTRLTQLYTMYLRRHIRERSAAQGPVRAGFLITEPGKKIRHRVVHNTCQSQAIATAVTARIISAQDVEKTEGFFDEAGQMLDRFLQQRDAFQP